MSITKGYKWHLTDREVITIIESELERYFVHKPHRLYLTNQPFWGRRIGWRDDEGISHTHEIYFDISDFSITSHHCGHFGTLRDSIIEKLRRLGEQR